jgi:sugar phosphate isomerase/epimerase
MARIYASTTCLRGAQSLADRMRLYRAHGIENIELGANVTLDGSFDPARLAPGLYLLHNYFPPPAEPFVLNLASADDGIRERSIALVRRALSLSAALGAPVFTVHAGFVTDPPLSFVFPPPAGSDAAEKALSRFIESIRSLLPDAERSGIRLLVENNVCEEKNRGNLLLQTTEEFRELFRQEPSPWLGILLDTGHLNVSACTFGFDRMGFVDALADWIGAFHLHDNDGTADQHRPVEEGSWIAAFLQNPVFRNLPWVMEAKFPDIDALARQKRFLEALN